MIGRLRGRVVGKITGGRESAGVTSSTRLVIETPIGLGYEVYVEHNSRLAAAAIGDEVVVWACARLIDEREWRIYGFDTFAERAAFTALIRGVRGLGPYKAAKVLDVAPPSVLSAACRARDEVTLRQIPQIGKETARALIARYAHDTAAGGCTLETKIGTVEAEGEPTWPPQGPPHKQESGDGEEASEPQAEEPQAEPQEGAPGASFTRRGRLVLPW